MDGKQLAAVCREHLAASALLRVGRLADSRRAGARQVAILAGGISRTPSALRLMAGLHRRRGLGLLSIVEIFFR